MKDIASFDLKTFLSLQSVHLCEYMEPVLANPTIRISENVFGCLLADLPTLDEYHLVYALQLAVNHAKSAFVSLLPSYLVHRSESVRCTAFNALNQIQRDRVTADLVRSLRIIHARHPDDPLVNQLIEKWSGLRP